MSETITPRARAAGVLAAALLTTGCGALEDSASAGQVAKETTAPCVEPAPPLDNTAELDPAAAAAKAAGGGS